MNGVSRGSQGASRGGGGIDLPSLVVESLEKVASPRAVGKLIEVALERAGLDAMPTEAHRMLLFVTGPLHAETYQALGAPAAFGTVQDLRPMLERAMDHFLSAAGAADTVPPEAPSTGERPRSGIRRNPPFEVPMTDGAGELEDDEVGVGAGAAMPPVRRPSPSPYGQSLRSSSMDIVDSPATQPSVGARRRPVTMPYLAALRDAGDVLIVDDDLMFRRAIARLLSQKGFEVMAAADGPSALKLAQRIHPVLVITDWQMPGLDGVELASLLHESLEEATPPIVLVTGAAEPPRQPAHIAGVIRKGGGFDAIFDALEDLLADVLSLG